jgi:hypothetical protein
MDNVSRQQKKNLFFAIRQTQSWGLTTDPVPHTVHDDLYFLQGVAAEIYGDEVYAFVEVWVVGNSSPVIMAKGDSFGEPDFVHLREVVEAKIQQNLSLIHHVIALRNGGLLRSYADPVLPHIEWQQIVTFDGGEVLPILVAALKTRPLATDVVGSFRGNITESAFCSLRDELMEEAIALNNSFTP